MLIRQNKLTHMHTHCASRQF